MSLKQRKMSVRFKKSGDLLFNCLPPWRKESDEDSVRHVCPLRYERDEKDHLEFVQGLHPDP